MPKTDAHLVALAREGDATAFDELVRRYLRAAHSVAVGLVGDPADAEDVCQDAFITALERLDDCRHPDRFGAWLLQIVRNRAHNVRRYRQVRRAMPLEDVTISDDGVNPEREADRSRLRGRLLEALDTLPDVQREVVMLHDVEGWKHREIGELLGLPEGTVRAHLFHARRALRPLLAGEIRTEG